MPGRAAPACRGSAGEESIVRGVSAPSLTWVALRRRPNHPPSWLFVRFHVDVTEGALIFFLTADSGEDRSQSERTALGQRCPQGLDASHSPRPWREKEGVKKHENMWRKGERKRTRLDPAVPPAPRTAVVPRRLPDLPRAEAQRSHEHQDLLGAGPPLRGAREVAEIPSDGVRDGRRLRGLLLENRVS